MPDQQSVITDCTGECYIIQAKEDGQTLTVRGCLEAGKQVIPGIDYSWDAEHVAEGCDIDSFEGSSMGVDFALSCCDGDLCNGVLPVTRLTGWLLVVAAMATMFNTYFL